MNKLTIKQFEEKSTRINGFIEKIYCRYRDHNLMSSTASHTIDPLSQNLPTTLTITHPNSHRNSSHFKRKTLSLPSLTSSLQNSAAHIDKKHQTVSVSSDEDTDGLMHKNVVQSVSKQRSLKKATGTNMMNQ